jgi:hypothetical protein
MSKLSEAREAIKEDAAFIEEMRRKRDLIKDLDTVLLFLRRPEAMTLYISAAHTYGKRSAAISHLHSPHECNALMGALAICLNRFKNEYRDAAGEAWDANE